MAWAVKQGQQSGSRGAGWVQIWMKGELQRHNPMVELCIKSFRERRRRIPKRTKWPLFAGNIVGIRREPTRNTHSRRPSESVSDGFRTQESLPIPPGGYIKRAVGTAAPRPLALHTSLNFEGCALTCTLTAPAPAIQHQVKPHTNHPDSWRRAPLPSHRTFLHLLLTSICLLKLSASRPKRARAPSAATATPNSPASPPGGRASTPPSRKRRRACRGHTVVPAALPALGTGLCGLSSSRSRRS